MNQMHMMIQMKNWNWTALAAFDCGIFCPPSIGSLTSTLNAIGTEIACGVDGPPGRERRPSGRHRSCRDRRRRRQRVRPLCCSSCRTSIQTPWTTKNDEQNEVVGHTSVTRCRQGQPGKIRLPPLGRPTSQISSDSKT